MCPGCGGELSVSWMGLPYHNQECHDRHVEAVIVRRAAMKPPEKKRIRIRPSRKLLMAELRWCAWCGDTLVTPPYKADDIALLDDFCSDRCAEDYRSDEWQRTRHPVRHVVMAS